MDDKDGDEVQVLILFLGISYFEGVLLPLGYR